MMKNLILLERDNYIGYSSPAIVKLIHLQDEVDPDYSLKTRGTPYCNLRLPPLEILLKDDTFAGETKIAWNTYNVGIRIFARSFPMSTRAKAWVRIDPAKVEISKSITEEVLSQVLGDLHDLGLIDIATFTDEHILFKWRYETLTRCLLTNNAFFKKFKSDKKEKHIAGKITDSNEQIIYLEKCLESILHDLYVKSELGKFKDAPEVRI